MRLPCLLAAGLVVLCSGSGRGEDAQPVAPSPLRLIPAEAEVVLHLKDPVRLAELLRREDLLQAVQGLAYVKEQLDSTQVRRAAQLLAYAEKTLGRKWPALLEGLAGGGVASGQKFGGDAPFVVVVQGKDEKLVAKFLDLAAAVVADELARQESKDEVKKGEYHGLPGYQFGKLLVARVGAALVVSNHKGALTRALELRLDAKKGSITRAPLYKQSEKLLPGHWLAGMWLNMKPFQASPTGKELYKTPRDNFLLTVLFGHYLDVLGRTPYLCAGLYDRKDGFELTLRAPQGSEGMQADRSLHLPEPGKEAGRPLLKPHGVQYSTSFYLDVARIWTDREKLFPKVQADNLTNADKQAGGLLGGAKLSTLLQSAGARHRLVVASQSKVGYTKKPQQVVPAFALVAEMRQPEKFGPGMDTLVRTGGLLASAQFGLTLVEEKRNGCVIVGYRFDEKKELKEDVNDVRFNFSPCFTRVQDQFVFCSTVELCRELVDLLQAEHKETSGKSRPLMQDSIFSSGFSELLAGAEDSLVTQTILQQAVPPGEAKNQVQALVQLVSKLGELRSSAHFGKTDFRYSIRYVKKGTPK